MLLGVLNCRLEHDTYAGGVCEQTGVALLDHVQNPVWHSWYGPQCMLMGCKRLGCSPSWGGEWWEWEHEGEESHNWWRLLATNTQSPPPRTEQGGRGRTHKCLGACPADVGRGCLFFIPNTSGGLLGLRLRVQRYMVEESYQTWARLWQGACWQHPSSSRRLQEGLTKANQSKPSSLMALDELIDRPGSGIVWQVGECSKARLMRFQWEQSDSVSMASA